MDEKNSGHGTAGHEVTDAQIRPVFIFLIALCALIIASLVGMTFLFNYLEKIESARDVPPSALAEPNPLPPEPRLDATSRGQLAQVLSSSAKKLEGYSWIDQEGQVVQIPIARAIDLVLERGLPVRNNATSTGDE
jgi:hypothetical protein